MKLTDGSTTVNLDGGTGSAGSTAYYYEASITAGNWTLSKGTDEAYLYYLEFVPPADTGPAEGETTLNFSLPEGDVVTITDLTVNSTTKSFANPLYATAAATVTFKVTPVNGVTVGTVNDGTGDLTADGDGAYTTSMPTTGEKTITVTATDSRVYATSVTIKKDGTETTTETLTVGGDPITLTATVDPANTTDAFAWSNTLNTVATITPDANDNKTITVTPVAIGQTTITATAGEKTAQVTVAVKGAATTGDVHTFEASKMGAGTYTGTVVYDDYFTVNANATVIEEKTEQTWGTTDDAWNYTAKVRLTPGGAGSSTNRNIAFETKKSSSTVEVWWVQNASTDSTPVQRDIALGTGSETVTASSLIASGKVDGTLNDGGDSFVKNNPYHVTFENVAAGSHYVTAANSGSEYIYKIVVTEADPATVAVESVTVKDGNDGTSGTVALAADDQTVALTATVTPSDATEKGVAWSVTKDATEVNDGTVTVTAAQDNDKSATVTVKNTAATGTYTITATSTETVEEGATAKSGSYTLTVTKAAAPAKPTEGDVTGTAPANGSDNGTLKVADGKTETYQYLNGSTWTEIPAAGASVTPGDYKVRVKAAAWQEETAEADALTVTVPKGETAMTLTLDPTTLPSDGGTVTATVAFTNGPANATANLTCDNSITPAPDGSVSNKWAVSLTDAKTYTLTASFTETDSWKAATKTEQITVPAAGQNGVTVTKTGFPTGCDVTASPASAAKDATITLTVTEAEGYQLKSLKYTTDSSTYTDITADQSGAYKFTMPDAAVTVTAEFEAINYTVTVSEASPTGGSVSVDKTTAHKGDTVAVTATPSEGYEVDAITVTDADNSPVSVTGSAFTMPAKNVTVSATFKKTEYTITVTPPTGGTLSISGDTSGKAVMGTEITVTATPDSDHEGGTVTVTKEGGGTVDVANGKFTMPAANVTVTATFTEKQGGGDTPTTETKTIFYPQDTTSATNAGIEVNTTFFSGTVSGKTKNDATLSYTSADSKTATLSSYWYWDSNNAGTITFTPQYAGTLTIGVAVKGSAGSIYFDGEQLSNDGQSSEIVIEKVMQGKEHTISRKSTTYNIFYLEYTYVEGATLADTTNLKAAITAAQEKLAGVQTSTDGSDVLTTDTWATATDIKTLEDAIAAAQAKLEATDQSEVDAATSTLTAATTAFVPQAGTNSGTDASVTAVAIMDGENEATDMTLELGGTGKTLTAKVTVASGEPSAVQSAVKWTVEPTGVISIDESTGAVTALKTGAATLTATSVSNQAVSDSITITVAEKVLTLDKIGVGLAAGGTVQLTGKVMLGDVESDETVTWESGNTSAATVTNGLVTAVTPVTDTTEPQVAVITAKATINGTEKTAACVVVVAPTGADAAVTKPGTFGYQPDKPSSDTAVAAGTQVGDSNYFTIAGGGTTRNKGTNGAIEIAQKGTAAIQFTVTGEATTVTISAASTSSSNKSVVGIRDASGTLATSKDGKTVTLITGETGTTVTYENLSAGTYQIISPDCAPADVGLTIFDGNDPTGRKIRIYNVSVVQAAASTEEVKVSSITISGDDAVQVGKTITLTAGVAPNNAKDKTVKWTSDNTAKATVGETTGVVTGVAAGKVTITATANDGSGVTATKEITVSDPSAPTYTISKDTAIVGGTVSVAANAKEGDEITVTATPAEGYELVAITVTDADGGTVTVNNGVFTMPGKAVTVGATFRAIEYTITVTQPTGGTLSTIPADKATAGTTVTVTATPDSDHEGGAVTVTKADGSAVTVTNGAFTMPAANVTVTATFTAKQGGDTPDTVDKTALTEALDAAKGVYAIGEDVQVLPAGTKASAVDKGGKFVTQDVYDALAQAIADAEAVLADENATADGVAQALTALNTAKGAFAVQTGTKSTGSSGATSGRSDNTGTTSTQTRADGTKVTTTTDRSGNTTTVTEKPDGSKITAVTKADGDTAITAANAEGEVVASVSIPGVMPTNPQKFTDVPDDHWAAKPINDMAVMGVVRGVDEDARIFDMQSDITRGAVATILFRFSNGKTDLENVFSDVAADLWYTDAVAWANHAGVVTGFEDGTFRPDGAITREQLAVMIARYAKILGLDTATTGNLSVFADGTSIQDWARDGMAWCVDNGIVQGRGDGTVDPTATATRAEAAAMLARFIDLLK